MAKFKKKFKKIMSDVYAGGNSACNVSACNVSACNVLKIIFVLFCVMGIFNVRGKANTQRDRGVNLKARVNKTVAKTKTATSTKATFSAKTAARTRRKKAQNAKRKRSFIAHKMLPAYMQKAYTIQKDAFVYARSDFDSLRITSIPAGTMVTISRKLYRPKTNFGTFYRIYLQRPKKIRAYISEIDVVPHYIRKGLGYQINPAFKQVKRKLHRVKQFSVNDATSELVEPVDISTSDISQVRWIGLTINHFWLRYKTQALAFHSWLFNLKLSGSHLVISKIMTDIDIGLAFTPTVVEDKKIEKGYVVISNFLLKYPLFEVPHFLFSLGSGIMVKGKGARPPEPVSTFEVGMGFMGSMHLIFRLQDRLSLSLEGKSYYDFKDEKFSYTIGGGLLVAF